MTTPTTKTKRIPATNSTGKSPLLPFTDVLSPVEKSCTTIKESVKLDIVRLRLKKENIC